MMMIETPVMVLWVSLIISGTVANNSTPRASTEQGIYIGRQVTWNRTNINCWYGIPYAQQPIGNLRWLPPQALSESNGTSEAYIANGCPQRNRFGLLLTESCLTLNVYAPENVTGVPVYVWIHGGSFTSGAGAEYDSTPFVSTSVDHSVPVVVVTINYRLGLLGFLADHSLYDERSGMDKRRTTGNYGILDQMMALDWIKKNINGFGGDPKQITIGGESAGGISVTILLTSPLVRSGTFQRAIIQSGGIWQNAAIPLQNAVDSSGAVLRTLKNCTTVSCLRNLTVDDVFEAQSIIASRNIFGSSASPVIDDYLLSDIMENYYARGEFQKVPILVGSNTNETSLFTCPVFNQRANATTVQEFFHTVYNNSSIVSEIPTIYGLISTYENALTYLNIVYSDSWLHCGSRRIASQFANNRVSSYLYTYDHLVPNTSPCLGVTHAAELPMLFPSLIPFIHPNYTFTASEQQLSTNMILYWASFIRNANPNHAGRPANWEVYLSSSDGELVFDIEPRMRSHHYNNVCSRLWDLYAVTNRNSTSSAMKGINKYHLFTLVFVVLVRRLRFSFF